jgi:hypothetical protein
MGQRETHSRGGRTLVFLYPQVVSDRSAKARERLKDKKWDGMESMMEAHAAEALAVAKADFHEALDWEEDSGCVRRRLRWIRPRASGSRSCGAATSANCCGICMAASG